MTFDYSIKARQTQYRGVTFRSRLEARWAAFFDECEWQWQYEPVDLACWSPDFLVTFYNWHAKGTSLLCEIKPFQHRALFEHHPCAGWGEPGPVGCDATCGFGLNPDVVWLCMESRSGSSVGFYELEDLLGEERDEIWRRWNCAGKTVQFDAARHKQPPTRPDNYEPVLIRRRRSR